jgi:beta-lactam-binding protein with PASTA domain
MNFNFDAVEKYVENHLRLFITMAAGILVFVGIIAVSVFFIAVRGAEQTMVPDVREKDLTTALLELQVKELYPRIQLRYSQSSQDKGLILEQSPLPGTIVKAGRRIRLVVSQGVMINTVENYLGRNIEDVRLELQTLFASGGSAAGSTSPLISLKEPFMYEFSAEEAGTILQQKPEPGTTISGPTVLELVISKGPELKVIPVPSFLGLSIDGALAEIGQRGVDFTFTLRPPRATEKSETVVAQEPMANTHVPVNTRIVLTLAAPDETAGEDGVFGIFKYPMPKNPYPLMIRLDAYLPSGETRRLLTVEYSGGELTVPYRLPPGTALILSMLNREVHRETVAVPTDQLSF